MTYDELKNISVRLDALAESITDIRFTPTELLAAAHLIRDYCNSVGVEDCMKCIFRNLPVGCQLFEDSPAEWNLSDAECRTVDWLDKQYPFTNWHYTDTDTTK